MATATATIIPPENAIESNLDTDVFIAGGGPAGLAAAIAARQRGFRVILADGSAPPIEKPCGEGLMPETLFALQKLGVEFDRAERQTVRGISFRRAPELVCAARCCTNGWFAARKNPECGYFGSAR